MLLCPLRCDHDKKVYIFISALQYSLHHDDKIKKKNTFSPIANCYYVHYVVIMSKIYFPYSYYVHYSVIMTKIYVFISALHVLHLDHDKKYTFFSLHSIGLNHEKIYIYFLYCYYVTTFVIMTKLFFFVTATFTTPWLALRPLRSG